MLTLLTKVLQCKTGLHKSIYWHIIDEQRHYDLQILIDYDSDAGRDWGQEEKGTTENEMAGWHHRLDGHEFAQAWGDGEGLGSVACCSPWGRKESEKP